MANTLRNTLKRYPLQIYTNIIEPSAVARSCTVRKNYRVMKGSSALVENTRPLINVDVAL